jgi:adenylate cyclase class IV
VVLRNDETVEEGMREALRLMHTLGIDEASLIDRAYIDML